MSGGTRWATVLVAIAGLMPATSAAGSAGTGAVSAGAGSQRPCLSDPGTGHVVPNEMPSAPLRYSPARLTRLADGAGVTVAVIDSGVDASHSQLRGRILPGRDFLRDEPDGRQDCVGHGTAVAGIVVASGGGALRGLAPGATILPVRVSERIDVAGEPTGATVSGSRLARAIDWAVDKRGGNATVVNMSLAMTEDDPSVRAAVRSAIGAGVVVVAAVGNQADKGNPDPYPASYPGVIGVGAVGPEGRVMPYSQRGAYVDLVAPGGGVAVAQPGDGYRLADGTSYAAPFVAATAALIQQRFPGLSPAGVERRLEATADPSPGGSGSDAYGAGLLNPYRALTEVLPAVSRESAAVPRSSAVRPAAAALQRRRARARSMALDVTGGSTVVLIVVAALAVIVPAGRRRGWLPGEVD